jgi:hypothetical protein
MFASIIAKLTGLAASGGSKAAAAVVPYLVYLTPALVALGCGVAFYLTHRTDTLGLVLAGLVVANEAIIAAQLQAKFAPTK